MIKKKFIKKLMRQIKIMSMLSCVWTQELVYALS